MSSRACPGEALESSLITGAHAQLSARLLERLAESVEELQRRAMRTEGAIARNNPPLFKLAQVGRCGNAHTWQFECAFARHTCKG